MNERFWTPMISYAFVILLGGLGCNQSVSQSPMPASGNPMGIAVSTSGPVTFKRQGWKIYVPLAFGTALQFGDLLQVGDASRLEIVCSDLTLHEVSSGRSGGPCSVASNSQITPLSGLLRAPDGSLINPTRGRLADGSYPTIISPRRTKLLSTLPELRWTPVQGARSYSVIVRSFDLNWSTTVIGATEIFYPTTAPKLAPGVDYKLIVKSGDRSSEAEPGIGLGFSILSDIERKTVEEEERRIEALGLPSGPTLFLIAYLYRSHGLESEAILKLETAKKSSKEPEIARVLGDSYLRAGLTRKAEEAYLESLELAAAGTDEEGQMIAHLRLGSEIYGKILRNKSAAALHLNLSLAIARRMGDKETENQVEKVLAELEPATRAAHDDVTPVNAQR